MKKLSKEHVSEDQIKDAEADMQTITNKFISQVDKHVELKEKEIMTV
ncbi:MAG TPA: ribosome recycling factor [Chitinophagales bacterium]|nr:ribosome recycling factor [Chitinophagales bacterium]